MTTALLIIDVQNDYFDGGAMTLDNMAQAAERCGDALKAFREAGKPVFHVQHLSVRPGSTFFVPDTPGAEIHPSVAPQPGEALLTKHYPSAFRDTDLDELLRADGIEELVICGAMTHMCVDTTVRAAFDLGYRCRVAEDACATRALEHGGRQVDAASVQSAFMAAIGQVFASVASTRDTLAEVLGARD